MVLVVSSNFELILLFLYEWKIPMLYSNMHNVTDSIFSRNFFSVSIYIYLYRASQIYTGMTTDAKKPPNS